MGKMRDDIAEQYYSGFALRCIDMKESSLERLLREVCNSDSDTLKNALISSLKDIHTAKDEDDDIYSFNESEFLDILEVLQHGARKGYPRDNWLEPDGRGISHRENHASICRHVAEGYCGVTADHESGLHPYLHAAMRLLMGYTRWKRGIIHPDDKE